jgi:hypothetical protein
MKEIRKAGRPRCGKTRYVKNLARRNTTTQYVIKKEPSSGQADGLPGRPASFDLFASA